MYNKINKQFLYQLCSISWEKSIFTDKIYAFMKKLSKKSVVSAIIILISSMIIYSCHRRFDKAKLDGYLSEISDWHNKKIENLKGPDGWLNLAGLFWLEEDNNRFGSDSANDIIFPEQASPEIGSFFLEDGKVNIFIQEGMNVFHNDTLVTKMVLKDDHSGKPTLLKMDSLAWFVIKRGDKYGVRLRDYASPRIHELKNIPSFPMDLNWKIEASFEPFSDKRTIKVPNVLGSIEESPVPGKLRFIYNGESYSLFPMGTPDKLFLVFGDETSGFETYGGGRFLYLDPPDDNGRYYIDFNKAYNPPCAFTPYATCPLPPKENILPIRITAREKAIEHFY